MLNNKSYQLILITAVIITLASCVQPTQKTAKEKAKSCTDCHPKMAAKFSTGYVHEPVQKKDCSACHLPHGLIGGLFFRQEEPELCYGCHRDQQVTDKDKSAHNPLGPGKCNNCHTPHNSTFPNLLKKPQEETCFSCHDRKEFEKKYTHSPLEQGCQTCHDPHRSKNNSLLIKQSDALCLSCHQVETSSFKNAHNQYPVQGGCLQCHTPHSGDRPALLKKTVHSPVLKEKCSSCHTVNGDSIRTKKSADALCLDCHKKPAAGSKSSHQPYMDKQCTTCHAPHASDQVSLLASAPGILCRNCHTDQSLVLPPPADDDTAPAETHKGAKDAPEKITVVSAHQPVLDGDCLSCHRGHTSNYKALLKNDEATLCLNCHDAASYRNISRSHPPAKNQSCNTCHQPHASPSTFLLVDTQEHLCFSCHRREADERGRFSLHRPFASGNCTGCHSLHKAKAKGFLKQPLKNGKLCSQCHENLLSPAKNIKPHAPVAKGNCTKCHNPHAADYQYVIKKQPGQICLECHRDVSTTINTSRTRHQPAVDGDCIDCHAAHGSPHENILKKGQPMLCLTCHTDIARYWRKGVAHKPAVKNCMKCHDAHGSNEKAMTRKKGSRLCSECHTTKGKEFLSAHKNIAPGPNSCTSCHDAHGSPQKGLLYPVSHAPFAQGSCTPCHKGGKK
ncbi:MAG: hypothetical protein GXO58_03170 [Thermodesulfobacteria bacterium]|nr:hypothetical protein [Thermodesulfobacteriota bacterium]